MKKFSVFAIAAAAGICLVAAAPQQRLSVVNIGVAPHVPMVTLTTLLIPALPTATTARSGSRACLHRRRTMVSWRRTLQWPRKQSLRSAARLPGLTAKEWRKGSLQPAPRNFKANETGMDAVTLATTTAVANLNRYHLPLETGIRCSPQAAIGRKRAAALFLDGLKSG